MKIMQEDWKLEIEIRNSCLQFFTEGMSRVESFSRRLLNNQTYN